MYVTGVSTYKEIQLCNQTLFRYNNHCGLTLQGLIAECKTFNFVLGKKYIYFLVRRKIGVWLDEKKSNRKFNR